jgi:hypothetical protein
MVFVTGLNPLLDTEVIFEGDEDEPSIVPSNLVLDDGRLAFTIADLNDASGPAIDDEGNVPALSALPARRLRVEDLDGLEPTLEIEAPAIGRFALRGSRLAYVAESEDGTIDLWLRDLNTDVSEIVAENLHVDDLNEIRVAWSANKLWWREPAAENLSRVWAFDLVEGTVELRSEAVIGRLVGGDDDRFVTEEYVRRLPQQADRIKIRRYDADGKVKELASFRADGLAGQTTVMGDRAVWVNPERKIVIAPLAGGDRTIVKPF